MNFGEKLRYLRKEKGLSQKEVAEKLNIGLRTYKYYEKNTCQPRTKEKLEKIAAFFEKPVEYLQIDDIRDKLVSLEESSHAEDLFLKGHEYMTKIFDNLAQFLTNLGWEVNPDEQLDSRMVATLNSKRIIFEITTPLPILESIYGNLSTLPKKHYKETHCIIIAEREEDGFFAEDLIKKKPPVNLTIPVKAYCYDADANKFESKEIYDYIYELGRDA